MPMLHDKADEYVAAGLLRPDDAAAVVRSIEQDRGVARTVNEVGEAEDAAAPSDRNSARLSMQDLAALLAEREAKLFACLSKQALEQARAS